MTTDPSFSNRERNTLKELILGQQFSVDYWDSLSEVVQDTSQFTYWSHSINYARGIRSLFNSLYLDTQINTEHLQIFMAKPPWDSKGELHYFLLDDYGGRKYVFDFASHLLPIKCPNYYCGLLEEAPEPLGALYEVGVPAVE